ncbi:Drug/metabolite transporter, partial [Cynara cardunculus var. scolymus]
MKDWRQKIPDGGKRQSCGRRPTMETVEVSGNGDSGGDNRPTWGRGRVLVKAILERDDGGIGREEEEEDAGNKRPKLTWKIFFQAFLFPISPLPSPSSLVFCSGTKGGKAKVVGTLVGVVGAMVLTFYKGRQLNIWSTHYNVLHGDGHVKLSAVYPCHYTNTFLITAMGCILSLVFALCVERSWSQWKLGWNIRLLAVFFMGIGSTLTILFLTTAIHLQGPLFAANFSPLSLVFVAIGGSLLLDENLHVGSVLGAVIIIVGLYILLWGKSNMMRMSKQMPTTSSKDGNEALTINAAMTALDTVHVARTSLSTTNEDNEMPLSTREKQEEQK